MLTPYQLQISGDWTHPADQRSDHHLITWSAAEAVALAGDPKRLAVIAAFFRELQKSGRIVHVFLLGEKDGLLLTMHQLDAALWALNATPDELAIVTAQWNYSAQEIPPQRHSPNDICA